MAKGITASSFNNCIVVSKTGSLKEVYLIESELNKDRYKRICATPPTYEKSFKHQTTWRVKKYSIQVELWARTDGRAGQENKYEFPPPVDESLFFGDCVLISNAAPFSALLWKKVHAHLFGGFDDLMQMADNDDNEPDELENVPEKKKTRDGYLKDGFIVDDSPSCAARALRNIEKSGYHRNDININNDPDENAIDNNGGISSSSSVALSDISATSTDDDDDHDDDDENGASDDDDDSDDNDVGEVNNDDVCQADTNDTETSENPQPQFTNIDKGGVTHQAIKLDQEVQCHKPKKYRIIAQESKLKPAQDTVQEPAPAPAPAPAPLETTQRTVAPLKKPKLRNSKPKLKTTSQIKKPARKRCLVDTIVSSDHDTASELDEDTYI